MSFLDTLRKLGIVRFGTKAATYTNNKDRPTEFLFDDVYNARKDIAIQIDLTPKPDPAIPVCPKCKTPISRPDARFCRSCGERLPIPSAIPTPPPLSVSPPTPPPVAPPPQTFPPTASPPVLPKLAPTPPPLTPATPPVPPSTPPAQPASPQKKFPWTGCLLGCLGVGIFVFILSIAFLVILVLRSPDVSPDGPIKARTEMSTTTGIDTPTTTASRPPKAPSYKAAAILKDMIAFGDGSRKPPEQKGSEITFFIPYQFPKSGFQIQIPSEWTRNQSGDMESFIAPQNSDAKGASIQLQLIPRSAEKTVENQMSALIAEWKMLDGFKLDQNQAGNFHPYPAAYILLSYQIQGTPYHRLQIIVERYSDFLLLSFSAPESTFTNQLLLMQNTVATFEFVQTQIEAPSESFSLENATKSIGQTIQEILSDVQE